MQSGIEMYPPFWMTPIRVFAVVAIIIFLVLAKVAIAQLLRQAALRAQRQATARAAAKDPQLLAEALKQLSNLYNAYLRRELSAALAVEQASALVRETYDQVMNHRTRYQAHFEIAARKLVTLSELVARAYPVEFSDSKHPIPEQAVETIFTKAKEVIESCR